MASPSRQSTDWQYASMAALVFTIQFVQLINDDVDWESQYYMHHHLGCKMYIIDQGTTLAQGMPHTEDNDFEGLMNKGKESIIR
ncbi:hypothetical protein EJB05_57903, partial [Eragrostis curvula]